MQVQIQHMQAQPRPGFGHTHHPHAPLPQRVQSQSQSQPHHSQLQAQHQTHNQTRPPTQQHQQHAHSGIYVQQRGPSRSQEGKPHLQSANVTPIPAHLQPPNVNGKPNGGSSRAVLQPQPQSTRPQTATQTQTQQSAQPQSAQSRQITHHQQAQEITRAEQRRLKLREIESELAREEAEAIKMTEEQQLTLLRSFTSVKVEFSDLDGKRWTQAALSMFQTQHRKRPHPSSHSHSLSLSASHSCPQSLPTTQSQSAPLSRSHSQSLPAPRSHSQSISTPPSRSPTQTRKPPPLVTSTIMNHGGQNHHQVNQSPHHYQQQEHWDQYQAPQRVHQVQNQAVEQQELIQQQPVQQQVEQQNLSLNGGDVGNRVATEVVNGKEMQVMTGGHERMAVEGEEVTMEDITTPTPASGFITSAAGVSAVTSSTPASVTAESLMTPSSKSSSQLVGSGDEASAAVSSSAALTRPAEFNTANTPSPDTQETPTSESSTTKRNKLTDESKERLSAWLAHSGGSRAGSSAEWSWNAGNRDVRGGSTVYERDCTAKSGSANDFYAQIDRGAERDGKRREKHGEKKERDRVDKGKGKERERDRSERDENMPVDVNAQLEYTKKIQRRADVAAAAAGHRSSSFLSSAGFVGSTLFPDVTGASSRHGSGSKSKSRSRHSIDGGYYGSASSAAHAGAVRSVSSPFSTLTSSSQHARRRTWDEGSDAGSTCSERTVRAGDVSAPAPTHAPKQVATGEQYEERMKVEKAKTRKREEEIRWDVGSAVATAAQGSARVPVAAKANRDEAVRSKRGLGRTVSMCNVWEGTRSSSSSAPAAFSESGRTTPVPMVLQPPPPVEQLQSQGQFRIQTGTHIHVPASPTIRPTRSTSGPLLSVSSLNALCSASSSAKTTIFGQCQDQHVECDVVDLDLEYVDDDPTPVPSPIVERFEESVGFGFGFEDAGGLIDFGGADWEDDVKVAGNGDAGAVDDGSSDDLYGGGGGVTGSEAPGFEGGFGGMDVDVGAHVEKEFSRVDVHKHGFGEGVGDGFSFREGRGW